MLNNNGVNTFNKNSNNTGNISYQNKIGFSHPLKSDAHQDGNAHHNYLQQKRNRGDDLDLYKSDSNFAKPVDFIPSQSNFISMEVDDKKGKTMEKTTYYTGTDKSNNVEDSSEASITGNTQIYESNINVNKTSNIISASDSEPKLQNIVSTVDLKCKLDLRDIALKARNAEYNPKRFAAVIMRIREPKTTALIFASGKMVCTGARSEEDSKKAARQYAKIIQKLGNEVRFTEFTIQNIVGSCDVKFPIRLEGLAASDNSKFCSYEPEMFPGLIYRMVAPKIVLLIFVSGKIVLTGAKNRESIFEAYKKILPILKSFKKKEINATTN